MAEGGNIGQCHQRDSKVGVDGRNDSHDVSVVVVGCTIDNLVTGVVDNVPCDAIIKEQKDQGKKRGTGGHEGKIRVSIQFKQVHQPWASPPRFSLLGTVIGKVCVTSGGAAHKGWRKRVGHVELLSRHVAKDDAVNHGKENMDRVIAKSARDDLACWLQR